jgi:polyhydroxybutyrate depolymerase
MLRRIVIAVLAVAAVALYLTTRLPSGASARTFAFAGTSRSYVVYTPKFKPTKPALVLVLHGFRGDGASFERRTNRTFDRIADREGFIVVYPDALGGQWNAGHPWETVTNDDVGFLSALIETLVAEFAVDPKRIYVTGFSNGASMSYRLACERQDRIAAVAPVAGGLAVRLMPNCAATAHRPIPLITMHGTADPISPFNDGELEGNLAYWVGRNGCTMPATISRLPDADTSDGTRTRVETYRPCKDRADVVLYALEGGGHHWPGGDEPWRYDRGNETRDFDAGIVIWDFFKNHPIP